jgi:hypothetical protein
LGTGAGSGTLQMTEYITTTSNLKGTITITADSIKSKGLMYDYVLTGSRKDKVISTGTETTTTFTPANDSRGAATTNYKSSYTIAVAAGELTINDAQYLFNPAFVLLPNSQKYKYSLVGNTLKVTIEYYDPALRHREFYEATFQKQ